MVARGALWVVAFVSALGLIAAATLQQSWAESNGYQRQKVVYHVNDLEKADGALRNVSNHLNAVGDENAQIIVVAHGPGALMLVDGESDSRGNGFATAIQALANRGVRFQICANTIKGLKIDPGKIDLNAEVVPSGVAQVAHLQQQGYLYVKP